METKKKRQFWSHFNTLDDFNKFIEENNIKNPSEFREKFKSGYNKVCKLGLSKDLIYETRANCWSHFNTPDDFNKVIEENNIKGPKDFKEKFRGIYDRAQRLNILDKLIYPERQNDWSNFNTLDDFNKVIEENNIKNPKDFKEKFRGIYDRAQRLNVLDKLIYPKRRSDLSRLNTLDDFNKFIEKK